MLIVVTALTVLAIRFSTPLLLKHPLGRRMLAAITRLAMKMQRRQAQKAGTDTDEFGMRRSDMEISLDQQGGEEAEKMRATINRLPPAQRAQVRRMMDDVDVVDALGEVDVEALGLGRSEKRAAARVVDGGAVSATRTLTPAQRKAKEKARAARKRR
ncbi:hypothetical protein [Miltoncostaea oceani]|uniref:hypothetical protein n=1 Tax=Miltoncostaea oceani TaxID=2843216 RepID=UPI001C3C4F49|nr:hypothetical protein [Miltoncostaea oceani]